MLENFNPIRYSIVEEKNKREIVMLRGSGCLWNRCRFCDYHLDSNPSKQLNFELNKIQLNQVTGIYKKLEVINSGSFIDLDEETMKMIESISLKHQIIELHFECHWKYRKAITPLRERFLKYGIIIKVKIGVETFDSLFRESYFDKGIDCDDPQEIAKYFDECCLLQGIAGQSAESMIKDIETGLKYFERVCVNIMQDNIMPIKADPRVIKIFKEKVYPLYIDDIRVDILMENTAFGVGGVTTK